ncbi:MAG: response regulator [Gemmatimonadales bacterium]|nr:MAG: response regulator [Gemmatimonadales bacterium]
MSNPAAPPPLPRPVLLVEDDLDQAHLLRFLLEDTGLYEVTLAQDGITGSDLARRRQWAVVVTDLNLPGALGQQVVEASREAHPDTPILATTGYTGPEYADDALARGADHVLHKPLDRDELLDHVARLAGGGTGRGTPKERATDDLVAPLSRSEDSTVAGVGSDPVSTATQPLRVLALGIRPDEVTLGAGGTLRRHRLRGDQFIVLVLGPGPEDIKTARARTEESARVLGGRGFLGKAPHSDAERFLSVVQPLLEKMLARLNPDILYLPTGNRLDPLARPLLEACLRLGSHTPRIFCYDRGDADRHFRPSLFIPVGEVLPIKRKALAGMPEPEKDPSALERGLGRPMPATGPRADRLEGFECVFGGEPWEGAAAST